MRWPRIVAGIIVLVAACAAACGDSETVVGEDTPGVHAASPALTETALQNAAYEGILEGPVMLSGGRFEGEPFAPGSASRPVVMLVPAVMATGDLVGDASDEAVVALAHNAGGSGVFMYLAVMRDERGNPDNIATISLGDRARITALAIDDGNLVADLVEHGPNDPMCCPTQAVRREWRFDDGSPLGSYNTQQHWVTVGGGLFLVYTRKGADNDHISATALRCSLPASIPNGSASFGTRRKY